MTHYQPSTLPNTRIDAADLLRAVAVGGIIVLHFIEHLNFYNFPPLTKFDEAVWDVAFFVLSNKMYAIFAMLFGLTLFVQHDNQAQRGFDFRPRFAWRMVLLFGFGLLDLLFFNGDILTVYAVCGLLVLPLVRAGNRVVLAFALLLALQPVELFYFVGSLVNPGLQPLNLGSDDLFVSILPAQEGGSWLDVAWAGLRYGLPVNFTWALEHGRFTQTLFLFLLGLWLGRRRMFYDEGRNAAVWRRTLVWSLAAFAVLCPLRYTVPQLLTSECAQASLTVMLDMWKNLAMMLFYVSALTLAYHRTRVRRFLAKLLPYGKMSLSNYIGQSVVGGFIFYHWGLGLYAVSGHAMSLVLGVVFILLQYTFCRLWLRSHKRGPLEQLWHNATWAGARRPKK
ncbi:MAG TPA: DUF418 domain-containing protein [Candidatus Prevotella stercoripullorum]|nr:DUF418 domain-containing protein [Candidatus Prevotella stercoripullorum]